MDYQQRYLKYKTKYLNTKSYSGNLNKSQNGGVYEDTEKSIGRIFLVMGNDNSLVFFNDSTRKYFSKYSTKSYLITTLNI